MPSGGSANPSRSGITTNASGEQHIPSSVRADGSVRKEIRVRPGYKPPEDVEVYRNRTTASWKNRGSKGVPGAELAEDSTPQSAASKKNAKRRESRKATAAAASSEPTDDAELSKTAGQPASDTVAEPVDPVAEKEKEAKKLAKKLRQARDLLQKREQGDILLPEQFAKVIKINELLRQLENLGFNSEGEKKNDTGD